MIRLRIGRSQNGAPYSALDWKGNRNNVCAIDIYRWHSMLLDVATVGLNALEPLYHHVRSECGCQFFLRVDEFLTLMNVASNYLQYWSVLCAIRSQS